VLSGDVNIYPAEIEQVLITMPGVADCAVSVFPIQNSANRLLPGADSR
jgi:long-chain acyl-CoA synthetase